MAAQAQAISTNYVKNKIWRTKLTLNAGCLHNMKKLLTT
jgi:hypothetical protein